MSSQPHSICESAALSALGNASIPPRAGYKKVGLYPNALSLIPNAPLITSFNSGFGTSQDTQSDVSSSKGTCHSFSLNGIIKCFAMPSPRFSRIHSLKDRSSDATGGDGNRVSVAINPNKH